MDWRRAMTTATGARGGGGVVSRGWRRAAMPELAQGHAGRCREWTPFDRDTYVELTRQREQAKLSTMAGWADLGWLGGRRAGERGLRRALARRRRSNEAVDAIDGRPRPRPTPRPPPLPTITFLSKPRWTSTQPCQQQRHPSTATRLT